MPPFEDYVEQVSSNAVFRGEQPASPFRNERPAPYEEVERVAPQPYPYEVLNRVLPHMEEPTDFQPLETQLVAQEQQINKVADDVKHVQQTVKDLESYLKGVAAASVPQNKAKNGVIRITMKLTPKLGEVQTSSLSEKELDNLISSMFGEDSTETDSSGKEKELDNLISSIFGEDSTETDSAEKEKDLENLMSSMFVEDSPETGSSEEEKPIASIFGEDSTNSDGAKNLKQKADKKTYLKEEYDKALVAFLNQVFAAEEEEHEKEEQRKGEKEESAAADEKEIEQRSYHLNDNMDYTFPDSQSHRFNNYLSHNGERKREEQLNFDDEIELNDYLMNKRYVMS